MILFIKVIWNKRVEIIVEWHKKESVVSYSLLKTMPDVKKRRLSSKERKKKSIMSVESKMMLLKEMNKLSES